MPIDGQIVPVQAPNAALKFYTQTFAYPPLDPWDSAYGTYTNFQLSQGAALFDNALRQRFGGNSFDVYFYNISNYGFVRYKSVVTRTANDMQSFGTRYNPNTQKVMCGFFKNVGNVLTCDIFESVETVDLTANVDIVGVNMTRVFSGSFDAHYYSDDSLQGYDIWTPPFGSPLPWGICCKFGALSPRNPRGAFWTYTVIYNPLNNTKFVSASTYNGNQDVGSGPCPLMGVTAKQLYLGGSYWCFENVAGPYFWQLSYSIWAPGADPVSFNMNRWFLILSLGDTINIMNSQYAVNSLGAVYAMSQSGIYVFSPDFLTMQYYSFQGGDNAAIEYLNNFPTNVANVVGFSLQDNALLISNSPKNTPLVLTTNPRVYVPIGRHGPTIPIFKLPCENFCLPLAQYRKV